MDAAARKAAANEKLNQLGGNIHGQDNRARSLATRAEADTMKLMEDATKLCKNPVKLSWKNVKFEVEVK